MWKPKFRFRLRSLLLIVSLCAVGFGFWGNLFYRDYREKLAIEAIQQAGGQVEKVDHRVVRVDLSGPTFGIEFSPDGKIVATGGADEVARLWDVTTHQLIAELTGHTDDIQAIAFTPDGNKFVTASDYQ